MPESNLSWHLCSCLLFYLIPPRTIIRNYLMQSCSLEWGLALLTSRESMLIFLYCKWDKGSTVSLSRSTTYFIQKRIMQNLNNQKTLQKHSFGLLGSKLTMCTKICRTHVCSNLLSFQATPSITCHFCQNGERFYKVISILTFPIGYFTSPYL